MTVTLWLALMPVLVAVFAGALTCAGCRRGLNRSGRLPVPVRFRRAGTGGGQDRVSPAGARR
jgi:hypothetical protein